MTDAAQSIVGTLMGLQYASVFLVLGIVLLVSLAFPINAFKRERLVGGIISLAIALGIIIILKAMTG